MTDQSRIEQIKQRWAEANDDIGIAYSVPADEWELTCDKPTMQLLRHARGDIRSLIEEVKRLEAEAKACFDHVSVQDEQAEAWDEGFEAGKQEADALHERFINGALPGSSLPPTPVNPYRGSNDGR